MKLLPLLCLLSQWIGPGSAQEIRPGVVTVKEDADALLPCSDGSNKIEKFDWKKDKDIPEQMKEVFFYDSASPGTKGRIGPHFTDRVLFFKDELKSGNASIKIKRTHLDDNGTYTCILFDPYREFHTRLNVGGVLKIRNITGAAPVPCIKTIYDKITWSLLECNVQGVPEPKVEWKNSAGETLDADTVTENQDGRFLVKVKVNVTKSDNYTCVATQWIQIKKTMEVGISGTNSNLEYSTGTILTAALIPTVILVLVLVIIVVLFAKGRLVLRPSMEGQTSRSESRPLSGS